MLINKHNWENPALKITHNKSQCSIELHPETTHTFFFIVLEYLTAPTCRLSVSIQAKVVVCGNCRLTRPLSHRVNNKAAELLRKFGPLRLHGSLLALFVQLQGSKVCVRK